MPNLPAYFIADFANRSLPVISAACTHVWLDARTQLLVAN